MSSSASHAAPTGAPAIPPAFGQPVFDTARTFRAVLTAMSRPGTIVAIEANLDPPAPVDCAMMGRAMAGVLLTLCDVDTPIHLDAPLDEAIALWSDFHTGAPRLGPQRAGEARFVFASGPGGRIPLDALDAGAQDYPDRSATCVWACEVLAEGEGHLLTGPGIETARAVRCDVFAPAFLDAWASNGRRFPRGVDLILTAGIA